MKLYISYVILSGLLLFLVFNTSCREKRKENSAKIDLTVYNLDLHIDSLLSSGEYIYLNHSPITNSAFYYSYNTSLFQFAHIDLEGDSLMNVVKRKPNTLDDVFDWDEKINRIEILPSPQKTIDAILLTIEEPNLAKEVIKYFANKNKLEENGKTFLLHTEKKYVDDDERDIVYLSIVKRDTHLIDLIDNYYKDNELIR